VSAVDTKAYYDEFARSYEAHRRPNDPHGYHALIDDLELDLVEKHGRGKDVVECGCGTGLLLERIASFAKSARGVDLSPGMLEKARARNLDVTEGSVTALPYPDESFDVACSFKVLAHVPDLGLALSEMARVTRPGGIIIAELYNALSIRAMLKRFGPAGKISRRTKESAVYTRFDPPWVLPRIMPPGTRLLGTRGVRIVTPGAFAMRTAATQRLFRMAEFALCDTRARFFGGFFVAVLKKD
jgi:ubiquinone/menaquinone biosynthesis C-methylase UbiE